MKTLETRVLALLCLFFSCCSLSTQAGGIGKFGIGYIYGEYAKDPVHFTLYRFMLDHPMVIGGDTLKTVLTPHPASAEFFLTGDVHSTGSIKLWNNGSVVKEFALGNSMLRTEQEVEDLHKQIYKYLNPSLKKTDGYVYRKTNRTYTPSALAAMLYSYQASAKTPSASMPNSQYFTYWPLYPAKTDSGFHTRVMTDPLNSNADYYFLTALSGKYAMNVVAQFGIQGEAQEVVKDKKKKVITPQGLKITYVDAESNAAADGLIAGDLLTHINNNPVKNISDVQQLLARQSNNNYQLKLYRKGKPITLQTSTYLRYHWYQSENEIAPLDYRQSYAGQLSFVAEDFDKKYATKKKLPVNSGVRISGFHNRSISSKTVLETDDIIIAMNDQPVSSSEEVNHYIGQQLAGQVIKLELIRKGQKIWVEDIVRAKEQDLRLGEGSPYADMSELSAFRKEHGKDDTALFSTMFNSAGKTEVIQFANALLAMNTGSYYLPKNHFKVLDAGILSSSHNQALTNLLNRRRWEAYTLNTITAARILQLSQEPGAALMAYQQALIQLKDLHSTPRRIAVMQHYVLSRLNDLSREHQLKGLEQAVIPALLLARHQLTDRNLATTDTAFWTRVQYVGRVSDMAQSKLKEQKKQKFKNTIGALTMAAGTVASYSAYNDIGSTVGDEMLMQTLTKVTADKENINNLTSQMNATFSSVDIKESYSAMYSTGKSNTGTAMAGEFLRLAFSNNSPAQLYNLLNQSKFIQSYPEANTVISRLNSPGISATDFEDVLTQLSKLILAKEEQLFTEELSKI